MLSGKVSEILPRIEHVYNFQQAIYQNLVILVKILWTIDCGENKTINLLIKNSTFSLECFLEDYKDRYKKFNEWTKVGERMQSEIAQVTVTFFGLQRPPNSSMRKHHQRHIGIFSNY